VNINNKLRGQPLKIMSIPLENRHQESNTILKMDSINLKNLETIEQHLSMEKQIEVNEIVSSSFYHTTIPLYLIILLGTSVTAFIIYRRYRITSKAEITKPENIELQKAATFALNLANSCST
jgi:hypothetical protein